MSDELPAELDLTGYVGPYTFPDIRRRRIPAVICAVTGVLLVSLWLAYGRGGIFVNRGLAVVGGFLLVAAAYQWQAAYHLAIDETRALASAARETGFAIGHASAQLGWRGLRSRPTWRILLYSADDPPSKRGLVLVDAVDGSVVAHFVEDNPEDWSNWRQ